MAIRITVLVLIMTAFSIEGYAASFDCTKAKSRSEILICSDAELSSIDEDLAKIYLKAKSLAPSPADFKAQGEREWKRRETTCFDKPCILAWYSARREQLLAIINTPPATPQLSAPVTPVTPPVPSKDSAAIIPKQPPAMEEKIVPSPSRKQELYQIEGSGYYGCTDKEQFKRLRDILMHGDDAAFLKGMATSVKKGECVLFNKGEKVSLEEGSVSSTVIRVKKEGDHQSHWTTTRAILSKSGK